ncbi:MAG: DUF192 domain-containing protein [Clostridia bacterium]|nr:DUF192 domain-containing protein [Clostridia bacterium]
MIVKNTASNTIISVNCKTANTFISRFAGLMGKASLPEGEGLLIMPCNSIHMFFMKFSLDIVFIDKDNIVIHLIKGIKPWRVSKIVKRAYCALELPCGTISRTEMKVGDRLTFSKLSSEQNLIEV